MPQLPIAPQRQHPLPADATHRVHIHTHTHKHTHIHTYRHNTSTVRHIHEYLRANKAACTPQSTPHNNNTEISTQPASSHDRKHTAVDTQATMRQQTAHTTKINNQTDQINVSTSDVRAAWYHGQINKALRYYLRSSVSSNEIFSFSVYATYTQSQHHCLIPIHMQPTKNDD